MKFNKNEAFGVCVMTIYGLTIAARLAFGNAGANAQASTNYQFDRAFTPTAVAAMQKPRTPDDTGSKLEERVRALTANY